MTTITTTNDYRAASWNARAAGTGFTADDVLVAAGEELARRGMTRGVLMDRDGRVCALGALLAGVARLRGDVLDRDRLWSYGMGPAFTSAMDACTAVLGRLSHDGGYAVARWNNNEAKGPEDVLGLFEKARKVLVEE